MQLLTKRRAERKFSNHMKNEERSLSSYLKALVSFVKIQKNILNQSLWPWCLGINTVAGSPVWTLISDGFQRVLRRLEMI